MTRTTLTELKETLEEIPAKLVLVANAIDKGNTETHELLKTLIKEVREGNKKTNDASESIVEVLSENTAKIGAAIKEGFHVLEHLNAAKEKTENNAAKKKQSIMRLWNNTMNSRKQAFFQHLKAKKVAEIFSKLLMQNPPKMPRKFLPKRIKNEAKEETAIRQQLSIEKFKAEINLQQLRSEKYQVRYERLDSEMLTYLTYNFEEDICYSLIDMWEKECRKEEDISINIFEKKQDWYLNNATTEFREHVVKDNKDNVKANERGRNNKNKENPKNKKENIDTAKVQSKSRSTSRNKNKQKNENRPNKHAMIATDQERQKWPTPREANQSKKSKSKFPKFKTPSRQRENQRFDVVEIVGTNNIPSDPSNIPRNETIFVPDTQEGNTQIIDNENIENNENDNFLYHGQGATNSNMNNQL